MRKARLPLLVSENEASHFTSLAKMISLCHALEKANEEERWASSDVDPVYLAQNNFSRKMREAIMFSTCGSWEANRIRVETDRDIDQNVLRRTRQPSYVEKYIDGWTAQGTPVMWRNKLWRKHR